MKIGNKDFDIKNNCYIIGILNVTPDSFSDGGKYSSLEAARMQAARMIEEGADIIVVGGESTRPGHVQISIQEEIDRVVPCIEMLKKEFDVPVSIDSYKGDVVSAALKAGADMVNDIWGLKYDHRIGELIAAYDVPCCLMHNRANTDYDDFMAEMLSDIEKSLRIAKHAGIAEDKIILDPGVGFGKTYEHNLIAINRLEELCALGYPVLLATSRKSVIGTTLDLPTDQRVEGTLATTVMGVLKGAAFVRVHDIKENYRAIKMARAIMTEGKI